MIAIDLGSNTIRFIEYDGYKWGTSYEKIVRAAQSLHATNRICDSAISRICVAIEEAKTHLDFFEHEVVAVATAALRMAVNGHDVIFEILQRTGIEFTIIDGTKEAQLTLLAVKNRLTKLKINTEQFVLVDIGGGSTELIYCNHTDTNTVSLPIGIVTMSEKAMNTTMLKQLLNDFEEKVRPFYLSLERKEKKCMLVFTSGTPTTIAAFRMGMNYTNYDPQKINGSFLTLMDCRQTYHELMAMDEPIRATYVGVGRELLIATGILMVESIFKSMNMEEAVIVDDGLREGVALDYFRVIK
ncbi:MAG: phosphatase [Sulfuricurvum sp.]|jgi:exopolyphosphatase/guanosine-5'-triphosphate,3'-diphosphate pyrophosphatase